jgi:WD40 repeat protein
MLRNVCTGALLAVLIGRAYCSGAPAHEVAQIGLDGKYQSLPAPVQSVDFSRDGSLLSAALRGELGTSRVLVFKVASGEVVHEFSYNQSDLHRAANAGSGGNEILTTRFSPDGTLLAISFRSKIYLYETTMWQLVKSLGIPGEEEQHWPTLSPLRPPLPGNSVEAAADRDRFAQENAAQAKLINSKGDGRTRVADFEFVDDHRILASYCGGASWGFVDQTAEFSCAIGANNTVRLWDLNSGRVQWERTYNISKSASWGSPAYLHTDNFTIPAAQTIMPSKSAGVFVALPVHFGEEEPVGIYDLSDGSELHQFMATVPSSDRFISFTPDGMCFVFRGRAEIGFRPGRQQKHRRSFDRKADAYLAMYRSSDASVVATFKDDKGVVGGVISPDGRTLLATDWYLRQLRLWNIATTQSTAVTPPAGHSWKHDGVGLLRFSPDGRLFVVTGVRTGSIAIYSLDIPADH